jgi:hypothetical protein
LVKPVSIFDGDGEGVLALAVGGGHAGAVIDQGTML